MMFKVVFKNPSRYAGYDATEALSGPNLIQLPISVRLTVIQFVVTLVAHSLNFNNSITNRFFFARNYKHLCKAVMLKTAQRFYTLITKSGMDKYLLATAFFLFCLVSHGKQAGAKSFKQRFEPKPITVIKMTSGSMTVSPAQVYIADKTAVEKIPNAVSIEAGGKGIMYSLNYDRLLDSKWAMGAGYSFYALGTAEKNAQIAIVPLYSHFYFTEEFNRFYITGGLDVVNVQVKSNNVNPTDADKIFSVGKTEFRNSTLPIFLAGSGWELRTRSGFLFRATGYLTYYQEILPWAGISVGGVY
jgi:hypothetical protein